MVEHDLLSSSLVDSVTLVGLFSSVLSLVDIAVPPDGTGQAWDLACHEAMDRTADRLGTDRTDVAEVVQLLENTLDVEQLLTRVRTQPSGGTLWERLEDEVERQLTPHHDQLDPDVVRELLQQLSGAMLGSTSLTLLRTAMDVDQVLVDQREQTDMLREQTDMLTDLQASVDPVRASLDRPSRPDVVSRGVVGLPERHRRFVGRQTDLARIDAAGPRVVVTGTGGLGKSALAATHARTLHDTGRAALVMWLPAGGGRDELTRRFVQLGTDLGLATDDLDIGQAATLVRRWLEQLDVAWLLVVDNAEEPHDLDRLLPQTGSGRLLATSRDRGAGWDQRDFEQVALGPLDDDDALAVLDAAAGRPLRTPPHSPPGSTSPSPTSRRDAPTTPSTSSNRSPPPVRRP